LGETLTAISLLLALNFPLVDIRPVESALEPAKKSPKGNYEFLWQINGSAYISTGTTDPFLRFRVYSQERKVHQDLAPQVTRTLLRLWQYNYQELKIDHKPNYNRSTVDVYLCWAGQPGGEQLFDEDPQAPRGQSSKVNTVYIYDLPSFDPPLERLREVAHEYGHASLPAVGGYKSPEYWANGYLGEKLFLQWMVENWQEDASMGASRDDVLKWLKKESQPLWTNFALNFPSLSGTGAEAMNNYIGMMLWMQKVVPPSIFGRAFKATGGLEPTEVPAALAEAIEGAGPFELVLPKELIGKPIFLPFGGMQISGAKVLGKRQEWVKVVSTSGKLVIDSATSS
jgi:hypothetical protein